MADSFYTPVAIVAGRTGKEVVPFYTLVRFYTLAPPAVGALDVLASSRTLVQDM